jgi:Fe-S-cluster-containing hydrogenase component 2
MNAIAVVDDVARFDLGNCIGCGLFVTTCPKDARSLKGKVGEQRWNPPEKGVFMRSSMDMEGSIKS